MEAAQEQDIGAQQLSHLMQEYLKMNNIEREVRKIPENSQLTIIATVGLPECHRGASP